MPPPPVISPGLRMNRPRARPGPCRRGSLRLDGDGVLMTYGVGAGRVPRYQFSGRVEPPVTMRSRFRSSSAAQGAGDLAAIGAVVGEFVDSGKGLGYVIVSSLRPPSFCSRPWRWRSLARWSSASGLSAPGTPWHAHWPSQRRSTAEARSRRAPDPSGSPIAAAKLFVCSVGLGCRPLLFPYRTRPSGAPRRPSRGYAPAGSRRASRSSSALGPKPSGSSRCISTWVVLLAEHAGRLPREFAGHLERLVSISRRLRQEREVSFYGNEEIAAPPEDLYMREDADSALGDARFVLDLAEVSFSR